MESVAKVFKKKKEHLTALKKKKLEGRMIQRERGRDRGRVRATFFLGSHLNDQQ